jgi:hypothetical protein
VFLEMDRKEKVFVMAAIKQKIEDDKKREKELERKSR